ncbi:winged helix-turn-helix domain-containing protein [Thiohalorhabdus sp. Cl-TMA]|uniref:Winged helix-turn-helix domain-containing protein n=1 Tax=Thiohalorhabdus methylotrophus TaxID=3242694 RepID=A0ABV4TSW7_9GAMM
MKVLLVEDDDALARVLGEDLQQAGLIVERVATGGEADFQVMTQCYDAVILDLGLPDGNAVGWLESWREQGLALPVLILTARERWSDKAAGFSAGADDYVTKPFETAEILFRLRALVRRSHQHSHPQIQVGRLVLDTHSGQLSQAGLPVALTAQEFRLVSRLMHAAPRIVTRQELAEYTYESDGEPDSNVIDVQISRLRRKLGSEAIETVRGRGYRMIDADAEA